MFKSIVIRSVRKLQFTSSLNLTPHHHHHHRPTNSFTSNHIQSPKKPRRCNYSTKTTLAPSAARAGVVVDNDVYAAVELALDSVVKIFTVASSPNYTLPWQNKSQRESTGSG